MSGESVFGWIKAIVLLIAFAALAVIAVKGWSVLKKFFSPGGNPAARASDSIVSAVSGGAANGGEDSLGGAFARFREWVSGDSAKIDAMKKGGIAQDRIKPAGSSIYVGDLPLGEIELPNPRSAR